MPSYDDEQFLELLGTEEWEPVYGIANRIGCTYTTANRRLIQLAKEDVVEVLDPERDQRGIPENEHTSRPVICYRLSEGA